MVNRPITFFFMIVDRVVMVIYYVNNHVTPILLLLKFQRTKLFLTHSLLQAFLVIKESVNESLFTNL